MSIDHANTNEFIYKAINNNFQFVFATFFLLFD